MLRLFIRNKIILFVLLLTLIGLVLRFYNLNWGSPFYSHPDERNIINAVTQLRFPSQMNPHFFAYGSLPVYSIYFTGVLANLFSRLSVFNFSSTVNLSQMNLSSIFTVPFPEGIIISRFYSAFFSVLLIPILFTIGKKINNIQTGIISAILATFSVGFIQFAHFGTFEMWLTFFSVMLFWICINMRNSKNRSSLFNLGIISGILISTKVSHLILLPIPILAILAKPFYGSRHKIFPFSKLLFVTKDILLFLAISLSVFIITNPYVSFINPEFNGAMKYESSVALGSLKVFYTGAFENTTPVMYQFLHVYPFLLNPFLTILFIPALFYVLFKTLKTKNYSYLILSAFFFILFLSQAVLYVKWTRYMVPTLPFIYLIIAITVNDLLQRIKSSNVKYVLLNLLLLICFVFAFSYFRTVYVQPDSRISALDFARQAISANAPIITEPYDLGIMPFNNDFHSIELYNFYELDNNSYQYNPQSLQMSLENSQYIILPSQRILKTRLQNKQNFPLGHTFYEALFNGKLNYKLIYETPCDLFCKIAYLNNPVFSFEETADVFDRPEVFIFKKI